MRKLLLLVLWLGVARSSLGEPAKITIDVDKPGAKISPLLWGIFFEDINLSADGGLYPELTRNRSFEDSDKTAESWSALGTAALQLDTSRPINPRNPRALRLTARDKGDGVANAGYWGMALREGAAYAFSMHARGTVPFTVRLESADGHAIYAETHAAAPGDEWRKINFTLTSSGTDSRARLSILAAGTGSLWLDMISLMPAATWKGHGLRPDLCELLAGLKPSFVRFPGGCWVEGNTMSDAYRWKETIGDLAERKPLWNIWGYRATHGIGYHEYLQLCEDLGAEPLFCINAGMSHKEVVPMEKMGEFVQDALDAIEYANGDIHTHWGALRAKAGHPKPFGLKYLEIGNENGKQPYHERWPLFYNAIKARHPEIQLIANVWSGYPTNPPPDIVDEHYYNNPGFFVGEAGKYDRYDRKGPKVFVGEYAVTRDCGLGNLAGAIGEAAFMTGLERNGDIVAMASYAPLFVNVNHRKWNPDLINFDSSRAYGLPSYYVQQLFSRHRGDTVLPATVTAAGVPDIKGCIGVGTWRTQAEFKDIRVTKGDQILYASDFSSPRADWKVSGGDWKITNGVLRQESRLENVRAFTGDKKWSAYTLSLKARKISGEEGFLISFLVGNENQKSWWNIGGWGNARHALEVGDVDAPAVNGSVETGRWYDIRVDVGGGRVRCYLDGKLVHDARITGGNSLLVSASRAGDEVIVKAVNAATTELETAIELRGMGSVAPAAKAIVLTSSDPADENSLDQPTKVAPAEKEIPIPGTTFTHVFPAHSLSVLRVRTR